MDYSQTHIITELPKDRHLFYIDRREQMLCVLIYEEAEQKSYRSQAYTKILRETLEKKGFRKGVLIRHRTEYREIEQWTMPIHTNPGILVFVPGLCTLYGGRYVSSDPGDPLLHDCKGILKLSPGRYQLYLGATG